MAPSGWKERIRRDPPAEALTLCCIVAIHSIPSFYQVKSYDLRQSCEKDLVFPTYIANPTTRLYIFTLALFSGGTSQTQPVRAGGPQRHGGQFRFDFRGDRWRDDGYGRRGDRTHVGRNDSGGGGEGQHTNSFWTDATDCFARTLGAYIFLPLVEAIPRKRRVLK